MAWDTWEKRIDWIAKHRGLSMSALSEAAGLARATVGNTIRRERDGGTVSFSGDTIVKLAKAARVDLSWLSTGEGAPEPGYIDAPAATDTKALVEEAVDMLVEHDGLRLPDALVLVYGVRLPTPSIVGYYRSARRALAAADKAEPGGERGMITREVEDAAEDEVRAGQHPARTRRRANK